MELPEVREAIDRRIEWSSSQPWSWEIASALGRVQNAYEAHQLARCEPIGKDRHGRRYLFLQGTIWIVSEKATLHLHGVAPVRKLIQTLSGGGSKKKGGGSSEKQHPSEKLLHLGLTRLLNDGAIPDPSAEVEMEDGEEEGGSASAGGVHPPKPFIFHTPKYDKLVTCAVTTQISGAKTRVFVLDLPKHAHTSLAASEGEGLVPMPGLSRYILQHIEAHLPRQLFNASWDEERASWRQQVEEADTVQKLGIVLMALETSLKRETFVPRWVSPPFQEVPLARASFGSAATPVMRI